MVSNTFITTQGDMISLAFGRRPTVGRTGRLLALNYARGMRRRERGVKVQGATSCAGRRESLVALEVRGRGWDR